jgi:16S rRNA (guanine(966)-N(2))-methyltransferase RsmD
MRIAGGIARGRVIKVPKGASFRPTEERVRQALFNIIGPALGDSAFLDLYCGSGAVALEALSRGARKSVLVDLDGRSLQGASSHAAEFGFAAGSYETIRGDARQALTRLAAKGEPFDYVFIDPPYGTGEGLLALSHLASLGLLAPGQHARAILEHERGAVIPEELGALRRVKQYVYGNTSLSFFAERHED